jgi:hypothetical protein
MILLPPPDKVRKVLHSEYEFLRTPFAALDRQVQARLGRDSKVYVALERAVVTLDRVVTGLLEDPHPEVARPETATPDAVQPAAVPDTVEPDEAEQVERVAHELRDETEVHQVGELAAAPEDEKEALAELRARHLIEEMKGRD